MSTSFLNLASGSRISNYLGLRMEPGTVFTYPPSGDSLYAYLEIPVGKVLGAAGEPLEGKALRNQHVYVQPACTVNVRGSYRFEVHPNPALWEVGTVQGMYYLEPSSGERTPGFFMTLRKDLDLDKIDYAVRIYMRA